MLSTWVLRASPVQVCSSRWWGDKHGGIYLYRHLSATIVKNSAGGLDGLNAVDRQTGGARFISVLITSDRVCIILPTYILGKLMPVKT